MNRARGRHIRDVHAHCFLTHQIRRCVAQEVHVLNQGIHTHSGTPAVAQKQQAHVVADA